APPLKERGSPVCEFKASSEFSCSDALSLKERGSPV
ncbi:unnamed protein product, partial [Allacma fusca]